MNLKTKKIYIHTSMVLIIILTFFCYVMDYMDKSTAKVCILGFIFVWLVFIELVKNNEEEL